MPARAYGSGSLPVPTTMGAVRVVAAPDKFRGTATARQVAAAIGEAAWEADWDADEVPLADGGDGLLDVFGGPNRTTVVTGPLGAQVEAPWRLARRTAVIEMARASGTAVIGGAEHNDAVAATSAGTGELILAAVDQGARRIIVGLGGSATTDGGLGAIQAIGSAVKLRGIDLVVGCDVRTGFVDAAEVFGPQKGATPAQVALLTRRLERLAGVYEQDYGVDVSALEGAGSAGGLAGGLAALGATLVPGFDVVAEEVGLDERLVGADLVITGEGFVDEQSYEGKVVGGVVELARKVGVPVLVIAGQVFDGMGERAPTVSLTERFGPERSLEEPLRCVREVVGERLRADAARGAARR